MIYFDKTVQSLPPEILLDLRSRNREAFLSADLSIIVLDDDPTGTQTMFDVPVLTSWGEKDILEELSRGTRIFFILTNSRSLVAAEADKLAFEAGRNIKTASEISGRKTLVISRSDSTLRGHYPNEVDALAEGLGQKSAPQFIIPAFFQGGRYTLNNIHYVREGDMLIPAAETPFAKDATFAYRSSDLKEYVEEKSGGSIKSDDVLSISIEDIRVGGGQNVSRIINSVAENQVCVVNAVSQSDLDVFASGFYDSRHMENRVIFRSSASIIPSLAGVEIKNPFERGELEKSGKGGIVAVGSYVPKTTEQLEYLKLNLDAEFLEINAQNLITPYHQNSEDEKITDRLNSSLEEEKVVVVYTSREVIKGSTPDESLEIVNRISDGMVKVFGSIHERPGFFIAKGGITSSDIATKVFKTKRAHVMGQIIPGVPLWRLEDCPLFPGLLFMPFPGNVGGKDALYQAINKFT